MSKRSFFILLTALLALVASGVMAQSDSDECPPSQFEGYGINGVVTPGNANNVRTEPSTDAELVGRVPPGEPFNVHNYQATACAEGYLWRRITTLNFSGWTVEIPVDGDAPFIVPYNPEPRDVGQPSDDGSIRVEESGIAFTVPAGLNIARVTTIPEVGIFGLDGMSAQPSSVVFSFYDADDNPRGEIEIFPYAISEITYEYLGSPKLETLLQEQPSLLEYAASNRMPQLPISGTAALFGGAGAYVPFSSGIGLRYLTVFAQDSVLFRSDMPLEYIYRGITTDRAFLVTAQKLEVYAPAASIPEDVNPTSDAYVGYLHQFEANLTAQPSSAFSPDLALIDALFASITITDRAALLELMP
jgi:hypothetical protein